MKANGKANGKMMQAAHQLVADKLVSMKRTPAEKKARDKGMKGVPSMAHEDYPWGMSISLEDAALKKLKLKGTPKVGDTFLVVAHAKVTSMSANASEGHDERSIGLQLTDIAMTPKGMRVAKTGTGRGTD